MEFVVLKSLFRTRILLNWFWCRPPCELQISRKIGICLTFHLQLLR